MMMKKLWLAVLLGVIFGFGIGTVPSSTRSLEGLNMPLTPVVTQAKFGVLHSPFLSQLQTLVIGLAVGTIVATSCFLIARRRS